AATGGLEAVDVVSVGRRVVVVSAVTIPRLFSALKDAALTMPLPGPPFAKNGSASVESKPAACSRALICAWERAEFLMALAMSALETVFPIAAAASWAVVRGPGVTTGVAAGVEEPCASSPSGA